MVAALSALLSRGRVTQLAEGLDGRRAVSRYDSSSPDCSATM
jgi:hypothetical protein